MRVLVLLSILGLTAAGPSMTKQGECLVDSGEAVSDIMDASIFLWAASKRCGKAGEQSKCTVDIFSALKSVNSMVNVIFKAVDKCGALHMSNKKCVITSGKLSKHTLALGAAGGVVAQKCPHPVAAHAVNMGPVASPVMCSVDLKDSAKCMFKSIKYMLKIQKKCKDSDNRKCGINALDLASSLSGMGEYLAGAVGQCTRAAGKSTNTRAGLCASGALSLVHHTAKVSATALEMAQDCASAPAARLYGEYDEDDNKEKKNGFSASLILGAFLPVTAIMGFVGGRFYGSRRAQMVRDFNFVPNSESDVE